MKNNLNEILGIKTSFKIKEDNKQSQIEREYQLMQTNAFKLGSQFDYRKYGTLFGNELSEFLGR